MQKALEQGYEQYRKIGTQEMCIREIRTSPMDELHCVAHVDWTGIYATDKNPNITIDFTVHYLMQELDGKPQIFGWISGDEQKLLEENGVV